MTDSETPYGFIWGPVTVERMAVLPDKRGRVLSVKTPRKSSEIYVTPTGLVRVFCDNKEWKPE